MRIKTCYICYIDNTNFVALSDPNSYKDFDKLCDAINNEISIEAITQRTTENTQSYTKFYFPKKANLDKSWLINSLFVALSDPDSYKDFHKLCDAVNNEISIEAIAQRTTENTQSYTKFYSAKKINLGQSWLANNSLFVALSDPDSYRDFEQLCDTTDNEISIKTILQKPTKLLQSSTKKINAL